MGKAKIDLAKAKSEYIGNTKLSYADIAAKYSISVDAVKQKARKEDWQKARAEVAQIIHQNLPKKIGMSVAAFQAKKFGQGQEVADMGVAVLKTRFQENKIGTLVAKEMFDSGIKAQTEALGLDAKSIQLNQLNIVGSFAEIVKRVIERVEKGDIQEGEIVGQSEA